FAPRVRRRESAYRDPRVFAKTCSRSPKMNALRMRGLARLFEKPLRAFEVLVGRLPDVVTEVRMLVHDRVFELLVFVDEHLAVLDREILRAMNDEEWKRGAIDGPLHVRSLLCEKPLPRANRPARDVTPNEIAVIPAKWLRSGEPIGMMKRN